MINIFKNKRINNITSNEMKTKVNLKDITNIINSQDLEKECLMAFDVLKSDRENLKTNKQ